MSVDFLGIWLNCKYLLVTCLCLTPSEFVDNNPKFSVTGIRSIKSGTRDSKLKDVGTFLLQKLVVTDHTLLTLNPSLFLCGLEYTRHNYRSLYLSCAPIILDYNCMTSSLITEIANTCRNWSLLTDNESLSFYYLMHTRHKHGSGGRLTKSDDSGP